ncbi:hypothetical protein ABEF95_005476 [Exophiala dermatitidis]
MPSHRPNLPPPPQPTREIFDPFNSSSTGHQRAENRLSGSTSWRDSRVHKLSYQLRDSTGRGGAHHVSDLVGAGSKEFGKDGRKENGGWVPGAPGLRERGCQDIRALMDGSRKRQQQESPGGSECGSGKRQKMNSNSTQAGLDDEQKKMPTTAVVASSAEKGEGLADAKPPPPQIFRNLNIYLNGSTAPLISDHKLKQLFAQHGGNSSITLGRRTVTHVVVGTTCGGGLASGKIQKEVSLVGGKGIKYVTAQWVLDSVDKGIRQPEAKYAPEKTLKGRIGGSGQASVRAMFLPKAK